jgi:hypothetical protein
MMNRGLPIVFVLVTDPLFSGFVQSLRRPGGTVTGFSLFEGSVGGKWLALLKEAAPAVSRVSMLFNPQTAPFAENYRQSAEAVEGPARALSLRCQLAVGDRLFFKLGLKLWILLVSCQPLKLERVLSILGNRFHRRRLGPVRAFGFRGRRERAHPPRRAQPMSPPGWMVRS